MAYVSFSVYCVNNSATIPNVVAQTKITTGKLAQVVNGSGDELVNTILIVAGIAIAGLIVYSIYDANRSKAD